MKKSVRCPPDYLQFTNNASSSSGMGGAGNPTDRGASSASSSIKPGVTKKTGILTTTTGGLNLPRTMSLTPSTPNLLNCGPPSSPFLSPSFIQNAVQQVLPPASMIVSSADTGNSNFTTSSQANRTYYEYMVPSSQVRTAAVGKTANIISKGRSPSSTSRGAPTTTPPVTTNKSPALNVNRTTNHNTETISFKNPMSSAGNRNSTVTITNRSPSAPSSVTSRNLNVSIPNRSPTVTIPNKSSPSTAVSTSRSQTPQNAVSIVSSKPPISIPPSRNITASSMRAAAALACSNKSPVVTQSNRMTTAGNSSSSNSNLSTTTTLNTKLNVTSSNKTFTSTAPTKTTPTTTNKTQPSALLQAANISSRTLTAGGTMKGPTASSSSVTKTNQQQTTQVQARTPAAILKRPSTSSSGTTSVPKTPLPATVTSSSSSNVVVKRQQQTTNTTKNSNPSNPVQYVCTYTVPTSQGKQTVTIPQKKASSSNVQMKRGNNNDQIASSSSVAPTAKRVKTTPTLKALTSTENTKSLPAKKSHPTARLKNTAEDVGKLRETSNNKKPCDDSMDKKYSVRKSSLWEYQSSKPSALSTALSTASGSQYYTSVEGTFKRKLNDQPNDSSTAKRRKISLPVNKTTTRKTAAFTKQWSNLLSSLIKKNNNKSDQPASNALALQRLPVVPASSSILPIQNSLLMMYDPIKILSRPALVATLKNSTPLVPIISHSSAESFGSLMKAPVGKGIKSQNSESQRKSKSCQPTSSAIEKSTPVISQNEIMPPPKFPPPWSQKFKVVTKGGGEPSSAKGALKPCELKESKSKPLQQKGHEITRTINLPYLLPKVNPTISSGTCKSNSLSTQLIEPPTASVTEKDVRLSMIAFARRVLKRNRRKRLMKVKKSKLAKRKINKKYEKFPPKLKTKSSTAKPAVALGKKQSDNVLSKPSTSKTNKTAVSIPFAIASEVKPKQKIFLKKHPDIIGKIAENPLVDHAIQLLRHKRDLQNRMELIEEEGLIYRLEHLPKLKTPIERGQLECQNIPLSAVQTKTILQKRLNILLAHGGFTHVNVQPLEVLADVLESFYTKMTCRLKQVAEMEMAGAEQEFPDPLERVLVEMGLGGVRGVEGFYKTRVVDYRKRLEAECLELRKEFGDKIRLKVGMVKTSSGGNNSTSSSTTTSSQPMSPGNSVITEILSGLEESTGFSRRSQTSFPRPGPSQGQSGVHQLQVPQQSSASLKSSSQIPAKPLNRPLKPGGPQSASSTGGNQSSQTQVGNPRNQAVNPTTTSQNQQSGSASSSSSTQANKPTTHGKSVVIAQSNNSPSTRMVSINLNNNVDLGGFVPITSPEASRTPTLNVSTGLMRSSSSSVANSKAKLKEALSQRNLLRLNFEQVPSNCDSTVILSSSSPSLSSSNPTGSTNKSSNPSSSISQTSKLKL